ncbi:MAG TPA: RDD family protein [Methylomirabilota bacterium]
MPPPIRVAATITPAGFWIRFVAVLIDGVVLLVAQGILFSAGWMLSGGNMGGGMALKGAVNLFGTLIGAAYGIVFHWLWGQTLGKMALQIKVVSMDGGPLSFGQATGRYFATFLSALILCIGFIMAGIRSDKRALHDLLAGTRVVRL